MQGSVGHEDYDWDCLAPNRVFVDAANVLLPAAVAAQLGALAQFEPGAALLRPDEAAETVESLGEFRRSKRETVSSVQKYIFRKPAAVARYESLVIANSPTVPAHLFPYLPGATFPVAQTRPTMLYGYGLGRLGGGGGGGGGGNSTETFNTAQRMAMFNLDIPNYSAVGGMVFPFLVIQFKSLQGAPFNLAIGAYQCAGASAACLKAVEPLREVLASSVGIHDEEPTREPALDVCYSIVLDNVQAYLDVAWKDKQADGDDEDGGPVRTLRIKKLMLNRPDGVVELHRHVLAILEWAYSEQPGGRLYAIHRALDCVADGRYGMKLQADER